MIAVIDYGVGNLYSLKSSFDSIGAKITVTGDEKEIRKASKIVLPGVGAFKDAAFKLKECGLDKVIKEEANSGKPLLGICLGMQLLFEKSYEYGIHEGLALIPGSIKPMAGVIPPELKIPHIGWNALHFPKGKGKSPIFKYVNEGECVYFVHSYYAANCDDYIFATAEYGEEITAEVQNKNIFGCQFHPEKSGETGLKILKAFCELGDLL
ncbi:MAG: imidazole glycerol phosphate synthase subunit HisH [Bacillota bacterium]|nr:imidazole glycerol phosphate synthase subunit HisH [Bacillota bacterium]